MIFFKIFFFLQATYSVEKYLKNIDNYISTLKESGIFNANDLEGAAELNQEGVEMEFTMMIDVDENEFEEENIKKNIINTLNNIQVEDEEDELSRRKKIRNYACFYKQYKKIIDISVKQQKSKGETNAMKAKKVNILLFNTFFLSNTVIYFYLFFIRF